MSILDYTDRVYHFQYENITERERRCALVTSHLILTPPPHTPLNYLPSFSLSLSIRIDQDKLKVQPQSSLIFF